MERMNGYLTSLALFIIALSNIVHVYQHGNFQKQIDLLNYKIQLLLKEK
jgi:hypothetical protein